MARRRKSWEKMDEPADPQVERITKDLAGMKAGQTILIATPRIVEDYIRAIPAGQSVGLAQMRSDLAAQYDVDATCPLTSGIFLRVVAEAANEAHESGTALSDTAPVWRMIDERSPTLRKLSFDPGYILEMRNLEGNATATAD